MLAIVGLATTAHAVVAQRLFEPPTPSSLVLQSGYTCNNPADPSEPQKPYRRYSSTEFMSALSLESQLGLPDFASYTAMHPGLPDDFIGYAFPNVDTDGDGLIDGMERMYELNWLSSDSDCDGIDDLSEFPVAGVQNPSLDPRLGGTCP